MTDPSMSRNVSPMDVILEAKQRYVTDPVLHARVEAAVQTMEREHGIRFDYADRSLATEAAACALLMAERMP